MSDKKMTKTSKLKSFLVTGSTDFSDDNEPFEEEDEMEYAPEEGEVYFDDIVETDVEAQCEDIVEVEVAEYCEPTPVQSPIIVSDDHLMMEIEGLKDTVNALRSDLERYTTSKEQFKEYTAIMNKRDAELANRKLMGLLEQLSAMREDFFKLCKGMNAKIETFSAKDVINSFEAYGVDMENILADCGVKIGSFDYDRLNTIHQRIVDVIPTDDESMNGMIAERVSDGYEYGGRVLFKERVNIYRFAKKETEEKEE